MLKKRLYYFCCCVLLLFLGNFSKAFAQGYPIVKEYLPENIALEKNVAGKFRFIQQARSTKRSLVMSLDSSAAVSNTILFVTPDKKRITLIKSKEERRGSSDFTWIGKTEQGGDAFFSIKDGKISGLIRDEDAVYEIRHLENNLHALIQVDLKALPPEHSLTAPSGESKKKSPYLKYDAPLSVKNSAGITTFSAASVAPRIDVLIAYTPQAALTLGNLNTAFQLAISQMNQSFSNSSVNLQVNLVGTVGIGKDFATSDLALQGLVNSPAPTISRDALKADVVVLVGHFTDACGLADAILATPATAYAVVADSCLNTNLSMAHEIGHLLGSRHDYSHDSSTVPFPYARGMYVRFNVPNTGVGNPDVWDCFHTIMSYPSGCPSSDPRINYWSNVNTNISMYGRSWNLSDSHSNEVPILNQTGPLLAQFGETRIGGGFIAAVMAPIINALFLDDTP